MAKEIKSQIGDIDMEEFDFTSKVHRLEFPAFSEGDLILFGCPTYAGRLPNLMVPYIKTIQGNGALAVAVVTFGNRNFDNSLIELRDILNEADFKVCAAAALSCEHSFSKLLGANRPDEEDMTEIISFAKKVADLKDFDNLIQVPGASREENHGGYYQPRDRHGNSIDIRKVKPLTNKSSCTSCGVCADLCPMGAIDFKDFSLISGICIKCCACEKGCPSQAKYFEDEGYLYHKHELEEMYSRRAENHFYI